MTGMTADLKHVVESKLHSLNAALADSSDGLPPVTVSVGVAFGGEQNGEGADESGRSAGETVLKHADLALYEVKQAGRNGFAFYSGD